VLQAWAEAHREGATPQRLEQLADRWLASPDAIAVEPEASREITGRRHSTPELLATERELLETARQRLGQGAGLVNAPTLERTLEDDRSLSDEQRAGVERLTSSGDGVEVVRAAAGTGKTRMLGVARHVWDAAGYRTIGCALSARAAFELEAEAGIDSTTIARLRMDLDAGSAIGSDVVIVVDEAGMVGTRDLAHLSRHAALGGAKLVLVGDDRQLPEIEAGGAFRALASELEAVELHDVRRQSDAWDRDALAALRHGRISEWADSYREHGRLVARPTAPEARTALVADWWRAAREPGADALMLAHRRADVSDLNRRARDHAATDGRLGVEELHAGGRAYAVGDQVLARRNDRQLGVINGARGVISDIDAEQRRIDVDFDRAGSVSLDARYLDDGHLDYGYAMTAHAAQGLTVDKTFVLGTDDLYREWGYTALTRHRTEARFYAVSTGSIERCLPGLEPDDDPLTQDIGTALGTSRRQDLAGTVAGEVAIEQARAILATPPPNLEQRIGPRPANPLDRDQWAAAAATLIRMPDWSPAPVPTPALDLEPALDLGL
jgi:ATP-dependent exoDNAse (exonuclease V) alpha subunit